MTLSADRLLDDTNWLILRELQINARLPMSELARKAGLSAPAVAERVRRLEDAGVIRGYHAEVDLTKLGYPLRAFIRLSVPNEKDDAFAARAPRIREILSCDRVTGTDCYIVKVAVTSVPHLEQVITQLKAHGSPITSLILSSPVPERGVDGPRDGE